MRMNYHFAKVCGEAMSDELSGRWRQGGSVSISTKLGDGGQTGLAGGGRVSKGSQRVESYGTVDELNSVMGFARSICEDAEIAAVTKSIQKELFQIGAALATPPESRKKESPLNQQMVDALTDHVHRIEGIEGVLSDWSVPGDHSAAAAYDIARTVCRRAERNVVRLIESREEVDALVIPYLNRLSDLLWLFGRLLEHRAGLSAALRDQEHKGPRWSRAW
jgi:cob(I)alamin adenosyltransferase